MFSSGNAVRSSVIRKPSSKNPSYRSPSRSGAGPRAPRLGGLAAVPGDAVTHDGYRRRGSSRRRKYSSLVFARKAANTGAFEPFLVDGVARGWHR